MTPIKIVFLSPWRGHKKDATLTLHSLGEAQSLVNSGAIEYAYVDDASLVTMTAEDKKMLPQLVGRTKAVAEAASKQRLELQKLNEEFEADNVARREKFAADREAIIETHRPKQKTG